MAKHWKSLFFSACTCYDLGTLFVDLIPVRITDSLTVGLAGLRGAHIRPYSRAQFPIIFGRCRVLNTD